MRERGEFLPNYETLFQGKTISLDIDGVLSDSAPEVLKVVNNKYGSNHTKSQMTNYSATRGFLVELGLSEDEARKEGYRIWNTPSTTSNAKPVPGSQILVQRFFGYGANLLSITARPSNLNRSTKDWMGLYFPQIERANIHLREDDQENSHDFKTRKVRELGVDIHLEDNTELAIQIVTETDAYVVCVPQPWNADLDFKHERLIIPNRYSHNPDMSVVYRELLRRMVGMSPVAQY